jgi:GNAT superfamily N-acetyltransferase
MSHRTATAQDLPAALATLVPAFAADPVWGGWAFPEPSCAQEQRRRLFGLWLGEGLAFGSVRVTANCEAVALWYPPGGAADSEEYQRRLQAFAAEELGAHAATFLSGCGLFAAACPPGRFWYLALLAVREDVRGRGLGMGLLQSCLAAPEFQGLPAYLESTHPLNTRRYQALGFRELSEFRLPRGPLVTRMWRDAFPSRSPQTP